MEYNQQFWGGRPTLCNWLFATAFPNLMNDGTCTAVRFRFHFTNYLFFNYTNSVGATTKTRTRTPSYDDYSEVSNLLPYQIRLIVAFVQLDVLHMRSSTLRGACHSRGYINVYPPSTSPEDHTQPMCSPL